ncbi:MAG: TlpA disulfide reductase family protein [Nitriliruptoraceae bacterium]
MTTPTKNARAEARRKEREEQRSAEVRRQRLIYGGVGVVVVIVAVVIAVLSVGETDDRLGISDVAGDVEVEGDALPPVPEGAADPAVGQPAPVLTGADFDGTPITVGDGAQVVSFVASWCPACDAELPQVVDWLGEGGTPEGVDFLMVATNHDDSRQNWPPQDWFADAGYTGDVLVDDTASTAFQTYGFRATPSWAVIGEDGQVLFRGSGMLDPSQFDELAQLAATG